MFPKIYYHFIEGQTFFKIPDVKLPQENSKAVVENAGKVSQQDAACLGLGWLYPGPVDRCWTTGSRDKPVCCLWVTKLQSNTVLKLKVFLQKVIKCSFLVFMTLFSSKELHFPTNNRELNYMVDSSINIRGTIVRKQRHC